MDKTLPRTKDPAQNVELSCVVFFKTGMHQFHIGCPGGRTSPHRVVAAARADRAAAKASSLVMKSVASNVGLLRYLATVRPTDLDLFGCNSSSCQSTQFGLSLHSYRGTRLLSS